MKEIRFAIRLRKFADLKDVFIAQQHLRRLRTEEDYLKFLLDKDKRDMEMEKPLIK